jgi:hypothetical protein
VSVTRAGVVAVGDVPGKPVAPSEVTGDVVGDVTDGVVVSVVVVVVDAAGVVTTAAPPLRFTAPPHTAAVPGFVTRPSVPTRLTPAGNELFGGSSGRVLPPALALFPDLHII